jgi:transketolase
MAGPDGALADTALRMREAVLRMGACPEGAHVGGSLSAVDILAVLYGEVLRVRPEEPDWPGRDWFVLSKGHASAALYAALADRGFFPEPECQTYASEGSRLAGHPLRRLPGVELPTGSLGHGLSLGVGAALGFRRSGRPNRVFVLLGDGELQEGSVWEAAMSAAQFGLDNLTAIVDRNGWQISGRTEECVALEPLAERWRSFGWSAREVDGHELGDLRSAFAALPLREGRPSVLIARTVKGKGVPRFERVSKESHYMRLSPKLAERVLFELRSHARRRS